MDETRDFFKAGTWYRVPYQYPYPVIYCRIRMSHTSTDTTQNKQDLVLFFFLSFFYVTLNFRKSKIVKLYQMNLK